VVNYPSLEDQSRFGEVTTMLNCLSSAIPSRERVVTCDEVFELQNRCHETFRFSEDLDFTVINGGPEDPDEPPPRRLHNEVEGQSTIHTDTPCR